MVGDWFDSIGPGVRDRRRDWFDSETGVVWGWVRGERIGVATALTWKGMTSNFPWTREI